MTAADSVRTALRMIFGSTGAAVDALLDTDAGIRTGLPLSRRVGFVSLAGGSGTTTLTATVAATLAGRRTGSLLAVDADGGRSGLGRHLIPILPRRSGSSGPSDPSDPDPDPDRDPAPEGRGPDAAERRRTARTVEDARSGLPQAGPLPVLDLTEPGSLGAPSGAPRSVADWTAQLSPIARFFDLVLTDWGVRPPAEDLEQVAASGHVLVMVCRADVASATTAADTVAALAGLPQAPGLLLVLVDVARTAAPRRIARTLAESLAIPVHRIPSDPVIGSDWLAAAGRRSARYRRAVARLAADVVTVAARSQAPGRLPAAATADHDVSNPDRTNPDHGARRTVRAG